MFVPSVHVFSAMNGIGILVLSQPGSASFIGSATITLASLPRGADVRDVFLSVYD